MYKDGRKLNGFVLNTHVEKTVAQSIVKAKTISLKHIRCHHSEGRIWQVQSQTILECWYDIPNLCSKYAFCFCDWAICGKYGLVKA